LVEIAPLASKVAHLFYLRNNLIIINHFPQNSFQDMKRGLKREIIENIENKPKLNT